MTTFVNEQVQKLDSALIDSFEENILTLGLTQKFHSLNDKEQFLFKAVKALDLTQLELPSLEKIHFYLEEYIQTDSDLKSLDPSLQWLFVAKCTIAIYGQVFTKVLDSTLPISESIDYWDSIHGNTLNELYYALQITPVRIFTLIGNISSHLINKTASIRDIKSFCMSPEYIISHLFPIHAKHVGCRLKDKNHSLFRPFKLASFYQNRHFLLDILRNEVGLKKKVLENFRSEQAARLGLLLAVAPQFCISPGSSKKDNFIGILSNETKKCVDMMKYASSLPDQKISSNSTKENVYRLQYHWDEKKSFSTITPQDIAYELNQTIKAWSCTHPKKIKAIKSLYGPPSSLVRYWIPTITLFTIGYQIIQYGFEHKDEIIHAVKEFGKKGRHYIFKSVIDPILKIYDTIRLKDDSLGLSKRKELQNDIHSLELMVNEFAKNKLRLSEPDLSLVFNQIKDGNTSVLLQQYEKEIKHPIKHALSGELFQTILIQVQKTKVDVDLAVTALDKLLKSNELNFAFLAVAPSILLVWASASWFKKSIKGRNKQKIQRIGSPARETLRRIEKQLLFDESFKRNEDKLSFTQNQTQCESRGMLICEAYLLRAYARSLPIRNSTRERFLEDIRDLENSELSNIQKIQTIQRMNRFWEFLKID